ncbi:MAG: hypothetical protein JO104_11670 [Candidatus Eremiobacteraeota bacterium]|nr:hypothetical protein [Candidatus Eremiobacteraeota bacterium]
MRSLLYGAATLALAILSSPDALRRALAASASILFEAAPFLLASVALARLLQRRDILEYFGCGCGSGPSARSVPAAIAAWLVFGAPVAIARYLAALLATRTLYRCAGTDGHHPGRPTQLLDELAVVLPSALLAGAAMQLSALFDPARLSPIANVALGAALGFTAAPCGIGAVAIGAALRVRAPLTAAAFLCVAGIIDVRALARTARVGPGHDAFGYALLAAALGIVAARHGDFLVNPVMSIALAPCAGVAAVCALAYRRRSAPSARIAPVLMLVGALVGAPPPQYRATETTLTELFAGERLTFMGTLVRGARTSAVARYAITCCRADAAPVAIRLDRTPPYPDGTWLRVDGLVENAGGDLRLVTRRVERVAPPTDPFIYR